MQCPNCNDSVLDLWPWEDGEGYKGLYCHQCKYSLWSDTIADQISQLIEAVKYNYISSLAEIPSDAEELPPWLQDIYLNRCTEEDRQFLFKLALPDEIILLRKKGRIK